MFHWLFSFPLQLKLHYSQRLLSEWQVLFLSVHTKHTHIHQNTRVVPFQSDHISVEPLPRVVLLLLIDHDSYDDAGHAAHHTQEEEEEHLHPGHGRGLGVFYVVPGKKLNVLCSFKDFFESNPGQNKLPRWLKERRRRFNLRPVLASNALWRLKLVNLDGDYVVGVG